MRIEQLPFERWNELRNDFAEFGETGVPHGDVFVVVDEDKIVAWFAVERDQVHLGPFRVIPEHRGNGVFRLMAEFAARLLPDEDVYVATSGPEGEHMCESFGMKKIEGVLYARR